METVKVEHNKFVAEEARERSASPTIPENVGRAYDNYTDTIRQLKDYMQQKGVLRLPATRQFSIHNPRIIRAEITLDGIIVATEKTGWRKTAEKQCSLTDVSGVLELVGRSGKNTLYQTSVEDIDLIKHLMDWVGNDYAKAIASK